MTYEEKEKMYTLIRSENSLSEPPLTKAEKEELQRLRKMQMKERIQATLEDWDIDVLLEMVIEQTPESEIPDFAQQMAATIQYLPGSAEYVVCKCNTMQQAERVKWFIEKYIHTTYNEQQANMF